MSQLDLFLYSQRVKEDADALLKESGILELLKRFGLVYLSGSYSLNMMIASDIDIYIVNPDYTKETAVDLLNTAIEQNFFKGHLFYDFVNFHRKGFPTSYYVGLKKPFKNRKWKIDIWFFKNEKLTASDLMAKLIKIDKKTKKLILQLKFYVSVKQLDMPSYNIYQLILNNPDLSYTKLLFKMLNK